MTGYYPADSWRPGTSPFPAGNAEAAGKLLGASEERTRYVDPMEREIAVLNAAQGAGYALLAIGEQLADVADAITGNAEQLAGITGELSARRGRRVWLRRRECRCGPGTVTLTACAVVTARRALADAIEHRDAVSCTDADEQLAREYASLLVQLGGAP